MDSQHRHKWTQHGPAVRPFLALQSALPAQQMKPLCVYVKAHMKCWACFQRERAGRQNRSWPLACRVSITGILYIPISTICRACRYQPIHKISTRIAFLHNSFQSAPQSQARWKTSCGTLWVRQAFVGTSTLVEIPVATKTSTPHRGSCKVCPRSRCVMAVLPSSVC